MIYVKLDNKANSWKIMYLTLIKNRNIYDIIIGNELHKFPNIINCSSIIFTHQSSSSLLSLSGWAAYQHSSHDIPQLPSSQ